jgi:hypothetical protein
LITGCRKVCGAFEEPSMRKPPEMRVRHGIFQSIHLTISELREIPGNFQKTPQNGLTGGGVPE